MDNQPNHYKRELILKHVIPALGEILATDHNFIEDLVLNCHVHPALKLQLLEIPGDWRDGHMWFSIDALVHSYYVCPDNQTNSGRQIWKKREFIFDNQSFYEQQHRSDYIQTIEPGRFISIPYPALNSLQEKFAALKLKLDQLSRFQQQYYRNHMQLLNNRAVEKVRIFQVSHSFFASVASNTINAMHVGLCRQGYENQLKKLK